MRDAYSSYVLTSATSLSSFSLSLSLHFLSTLASSQSEKVILGHGNTTNALVFITFGRVQLFIYTSDAFGEINVV